MEYNIYCDESCHLENDSQKAMVLGAIWCPKDKIIKINNRINQIKEKYDLSKYFEIKWTKISPSKFEFYEEILNYFFDNEDLHFRALIIPDKSMLDHKAHVQNHETWYYKMYFDLLKIILNPEDQYNIYVDIKDTKSALKIAQLHEVLSNNIYDFSRSIVNKIQTVRSHEIKIIQLTDFLIGAISYFYRKLNTSESKLKIIGEIKKLSGYSLESSTLLRENKFNIFIWHPSTPGNKGII